MNLSKITLGWLLLLTMILHFSAVHSAKAADTCDALLEAANKTTDALHAEFLAKVAKASVIKDKKQLVMAQCEYIAWSFESYYPVVIASKRQLAASCSHRGINGMPASYYEEHRKESEKVFAEYCKAARPSSRPSISALGSCSDITGTSSKEPAAKHCNNAKAQLHGARINRNKIPGYSAEQYKAAAATYRLAGDHARALLVEAEAAEPELEAFKATEALLTNKNKVAADAMFALEIARKTELGAYEDKSCSDLRIAADRYEEAGQAFLKASQIDRTNQMYQRRNELVEIVNRAKQAGRCDTPSAPVKPMPVDKASSLPDVAASECERIYQHINKNLELQDEQEGKVAMVALAARGCTNPQGQRQGLFWRYACVAAMVSWKDDQVAATEIIGRLQKAQCPPGVQKMVIN